MSFLENYHIDYLNYLFQTRTLPFGSTSRPIVEAGVQVLMLKDVTIRPISPTKCIYTFECVKEHADIKYVPIFKTYEVSMVQGKISDEGIRMTNFVLMAFALEINFIKSGFIEVFTQLTKLKKTSFNAVIAYNRELIVTKGRIYPDDSPFAVRIFGYSSYKSLFSSYIIFIKTIDNPIYPTDYDVRSLIGGYTENEQFLINKTKLSCQK